MSFFYRVVRNCSQSFTLQARQAAISHYSNHYEVRDIVFSWEPALETPNSRDDDVVKNRARAKLMVPY